MFQILIRSFVPEFFNHLEDQFCQTYLFSSKIGGEIEFTLSFILKPLFFGCEFPALIICHCTVKSSFKVCCRNTNFVICLLNSMNRGPYRKLHPIANYTYLLEYFRHFDFSKFPWIRGFSAGISSAVQFDNAVKSLF